MILTEKLEKEPRNEADLIYCFCGYLPVSLAKQKQEWTAVSVEGGDDEGEASRGGGRGGHMDSDSSDSKVVGPPLPPGYEVMLLIDVFGTDVLSVAASVVTKRSFSGLCPLPSVLNWFSV